MPLLTWIAELADDPLVLDPDDRPAEQRTNTWWMTAEEEDRRTLTVQQVVDAFERTAALLLERVRALGHHGPATFYVWHDVLAGQLRCSTGSVGPRDLPFRGNYLPTTDLGPIVADHLADDEPGTVLRTELVDIGDLDEPPNDGDVLDADGNWVPGPPLPPLPVWVRDVGTAGGA
ncbi:hypothetical protein ACFWXO_10195 [Kitasatospora sp. NPDC059088]|uniref:hypothetical protein n=1 Tax=Kitasatospora sp. NPDC059088 TaxID=3346722 RepID=UPI0036748459